MTAVCITCEFLLTSRVGDSFSEESNAVSRIDFVASVLPLLFLDYHPLLRTRVQESGPGHGAKRRAGGW
jgi:hypothetical protein